MTSCRLSGQACLRLWAIFPGVSLLMGATAHRPPGLRSSERAAPSGSSRVGPSVGRNVCLDADSLMRAMVYCLTRPSPSRAATRKRSRNISQNASCCNSISSRPLATRECLHCVRCPVQIQGVLPARILYFEAWDRLAFFPGRPSPLIRVRGHFPSTRLHPRVIKDPEGVLCWTSCNGRQSPPSVFLCGSLDFSRMRFIWSIRL